MRLQALAEEFGLDLACWKSNWLRSYRHRKDQAKETTDPSKIHLTSRIGPSLQDSRIGHFHLISPS